MTVFTVLAFWITVPKVSVTNPRLCQLAHSTQPSFREYSYINIITSQLFHGHTSSVFKDYYTPCGKNVF